MELSTITLIAESAWFRGCYNLSELKENELLSEDFVIFNEVSLKMANSYYSIFVYKREVETKLYYLLFKIQENFPFF